MPYLQVDLDALDEFEAVSTSSGVLVGDISIGCLRMWKHCWKAKTAYVTRDRLLGFFPGDAEKVIRALVASEFIDLPGSRPDIHVRGAEKRLGLLSLKSEAGKKGGKASAKKKKSLSNLRQNQEITEAPASVVLEATEAPPKQTPKLLHPTSNIQHPAVKNLAPETTAPGWKELLVSLFAAFKVEKGCDPTPRPKDFKALKELRARAPDPEILVRWVRGLRGQYARQAETFWDLSDRWDRLATDGPSPNAVKTLRTDTTDADFERGMAKYKTNEHGDLLF